jgi:glycosyltransferase involved in cell wall biosynthesis
MVPRFSVVIPCYNEAGYIAEALRSLHNQTYAGEYEIVVVDNNCTDNTAEIARELGARVVVESNPGVCNARQRGTEASTGTIVVSADADTTLAPDWLEKIDRMFGDDDAIAAVVGPCRYKDGPLWGRVYARALFGAVGLIYRTTGRTLYATATNIAFRRDRWSGYNVLLTQGGDELDVLRNLRAKGRVVYDRTNPTFTSGRRFTRGLAYNLFVSLLVFYLSAYFLNRFFGRRVLGSAPAYRDSQSAALRHVRTAAGAALGVLAVLVVFTEPRHYLFRATHAVVAELTAGVDWDDGK